MAAPATIEEFVDLVRRSTVVEERRLDQYVERLRAGGTMPADAGKLAGVMVRDGVLTRFQAEQMLLGRWRRFSIGKYKVLEKIGSGGMGMVYLCEHKLMRRRVAVKVLPTAKAKDPASLERFQREARAVAALDHPNIVHAYDIDQDDELHFLVMEYVDGSSFQDIIKKTGPMAVARAAHYIRQAALGIEHAHAKGLVHRDIKPGNIVVDRGGVVKVLDMGLARFFNDDEDVLTKKYDENVLGTADYLSPEQIEDSHNVDTRADIYSLGATFYYILTGQPPFGEGTVHQKLSWHMTRQPKPVSSVRPGVPEALSAIIARMMAKKPGDRYATLGEVAQALAPWTQTPIGPPAEAEMPELFGVENNWAADTGATVVSKGASTPGPAVRPEPRPTPSSPSVALSPAPTAPAPVPAPTSTRPASAASVSVPPVPAPTSRRPASAASVSVPSVPAPTSARPASAASVSVPPVSVPASARPASAASISAGPASASPVSAVVLRTKETAAASPAAAGPAAARGAAATAARPALRPAASASAQTAAVDEEVPWKSLGDTDSPMASMGDTAPQSGQQVVQARAAATRRRRLVFVVALVVFVGSVAFGLWQILRSRTSANVPSARAALEVSRDPARTKAYRSIREALNHAHAGDVIELTDPRHVETLVIDRPTDVTIRAKPGLEVVWSPSDKDPLQPLLFLTGARGFHLNGKGITLDGAIDGKRRIKTLVSIQSNSPGLVLENAQLRGFESRGVQIMNTWGERAKPVRLSNLEISGGDKAEAGIYFDANAKMNPPYNDYIEIDASCRFPGFSDDRAITRKLEGVIGSSVKRPGNWK